MNNRTRTSIGYEALNNTVWQNSSRGTTYEYKEYDESSGNIYAIFGAIFMENTNSGNNGGEALREMLKNMGASFNRESGERKMYDLINAEIFFKKLKFFLELAPEKLKNEFVAELIQSIEHAYLSGNYSQLTVFIDEWFDTVDIYSDKESVKDYEDAIKELDAGKGIVWTPETFSE